MIKAYNYALALSAVSWALLRVFKIPIEERFTIVNLSIIAFHLQVGFLFYSRTPITSRIPLRSLVIGLSSLVTGGVILMNAPPLNTWPIACSVCFLISTLWVIYSFTFLGKSFAVLPVARELVVKGPYSYVRHPAYLGEIGMMTSTALAAVFTLPHIAIPFLILAFLAIGWRIIEEEKVLTNQLDYETYKEKVTCRLLPFLW